MACKLWTQCDLIFGILKCTLLEDTIDEDLKVHTQSGIHTYRKDRSTQIIKSLGELTSSPTYQKMKMVDFMKCRQIMATPFANRFFQPRPKVSNKEVQPGATYQNEQSKTFPAQKKIRTTSYSVKFDSHTWKS